MQEHHGPAKETDITNILVITFVVLVAVMIAKVAGDFSTKSTSTSTRADEPTTYKKFCQDKVQKNIGTKYDSTKVKDQVFAKTYTTDCGSLNHKFATGVLINENGTSEPGICCVPLTTLYAVNDTYCINDLPIYAKTIPVKCKDNNSCSGKYGSDSNGEYTFPLKSDPIKDVRCDNVTTTKVGKDSNYCCIRPLDVKKLTPTPKP